MSVTNFKKIFISCFIPYFLLVCTFIILMGLGLWQMHRASEKSQILQGFYAQQQRSFCEWNSTLPLPNQFARVFFKGVVRPERLYLDNQFYQHHVGYNVLIPVEVEKNKVVLVDMGWIASMPNRQQLPDVTIDLQQDNWQGTVYYPRLSSVDLGEFVDLHQGDLYRIERLSTKNVSEVLNRQVYPWVLRLSSEHPKELKREWPLIAVTPQRHHAYALQWFLMALIIFVIILRRIVK
jgi:surfeit locus 1 family protein